jgi:hypothetical protein
MRVYQEVGLEFWQWPDEARDRLRYLSKKGSTEKAANEIIRILKRDNLV